RRGKRRAGAGGRCPPRRGGGGACTPGRKKTLKRSRNGNVAPRPGGGALAALPYRVAATLFSYTIMAESLQDLAREITALLWALPNRTIPPIRALRREFSKRLAKADHREVVELALLLLEQSDLESRFVAYELVCHHRPALRSLTARDLERLGRG